MDILSFAEAVGVTLYPVQRVVMKLAYGLPLDDDVREIEVPTDWTRSEVWQMTEAEYVQRLHAEGRCSVERPPTEAPPAFYGSIGRRGGKTLLTSLALAFETKACTQEDESRKINNVVVSTRHDEARLTFEVAADLVRRDCFLNERLANDTRTEATFQTARDIEQHGPWAGSRRTAHASVALRALPSTTRAIRGLNLHLIALDEYAHFPKASAEEFTRLREGRLLALSSPTPEATAFTKAFNSDNVWVKIPTWEMVPGIPREEFERAREHLSHVAFMTEYGAQFCEKIELPLPDSLHHDLEKLAAREGKDLQDVVNEALECAVDKERAFWFSRS